MKKVKKINIQSDVFHQVKPSRLLELQELVENGSKYAICKFTSTVTVPIPPTPYEIWAAHYLGLTNQQVYDILSKAINVVKDTEKFMEYQLWKSFESGKDMKYNIPPGTVRIFSRDLMCFYNGNIWKKLEL